MDVNEEFKKKMKELENNLNKLTSAESVEDISISAVVSTVSNIVLWIAEHWDLIEPALFFSAFAGIFYAWWNAMRWLIERLYAFLMPKPPVTYEKAMEAGARFLAISASLSTFPMLIRLIGSAKGRDAAQIADNLAKAFELPYWTLGLGFLGWQVMAIPLEFAIRDPLRRHFNKIYGSRLLPRSVMERLYRLDLITEEELVEYYVEYGYDDESIKRMIMDQRARKYEDKIKELKKEKDKWVKLLAKAKAEERA